MGSVAVYRFLAEGWTVRVVDNLLHGGESLLAAMGHPRFEFVRADVTEPGDWPHAYEGADAVLHLAAIVGEPACNRDETRAWKVNYEGAIASLGAAKAAGVPRFVFTSTCSNYGIQPGDHFADESSPVNPISTYAESKVKAEKEILASAADGFAPTVLRLSTAFGLSPRMRFDLLVSDFVREAFSKKKLVVYGRQFWRPYVHTADIAEALRLVVEADPAKVSGEVYNVGDDAENYRKEQIVEAACAALLETEVEYVDVGSDPRSYRVSARKIQEALGYKSGHTVADGVAELLPLLEAGFFPEPYDGKYTN